MKKISTSGWDNSSIKYGNRVIAKIVPTVNSKELTEFFQLIAAAPEMLEALKLTMIMFPSEMRGSVVEAAITKAEGKSE